MTRDESGFAARVLGCLSSGIVGIDAAGKMVLLNEGARRILGFPEGSTERVIGRDCRSALNAYPTMARLLLETLEGREALSRAELVLEAPGWRAGSTIGFTLSPVRDESGDVCGATMLFRDLTPFERSDEQERLRDRLAALGEMAAGLAHEIRNPLAGMELVTGLLQRRLADCPEEQELLSELSGQLGELAETVTESLEFVRPIALTRALVDPVGLLEASLTRALARAPRPSAIERCYDERLPLIAADADLIGAALTNLIVNACEAMAACDGRQPSRLVLELNERVAQRPTRSVRVEDGRADSREPDAPSRELVISISDNGPGIPTELREKVFYPFFTTKESGSGIGLANVQKVVLAHGGSVALEVPGASGCTFGIHLPVLEVGEELEAQEAPEAEPADVGAV
jgi:nitrogen-specific signal transduction histidine kinase